MFKLIEINPINDAHAILIVEAFNKYIVIDGGIANEYGCVGDTRGDGCNNEYKAHQLRQAFADFD